MPRKTFPRAFITVGQWSLSGPDSAQFCITSLKIRAGDTIFPHFCSIRDYENPSDADSDNVYEATLEVVLDDGSHGSLDLTVAVTNINEDPTGRPTISGTAQVGHTLTAGTSELSDPDGMDNASFSYQWITSNGSRFIHVDGATDSTYTIQAADAGRLVRVLVEFTGDGGSEETVSSYYTEAAAPPGGL